MNEKKRKWPLLVKEEIELDKEGNKKRVRWFYKMLEEDNQQPVEQVDPQVEQIEHEILNALWNCEAKRIGGSLGFYPQSVIMKELRKQGCRYQPKFVFEFLKYLYKIGRVHHIKPYYRAQSHWRLRR